MVVCFFVHLACFASLHCPRQIVCNMYLGWWYRVVPIFARFSAAPSGVTPRSGLGVFRLIGLSPPSRRNCGALETDGLNLRATPCVVYIFGVVWYGDRVCVCVCTYCVRSITCLRVGRDYVVDQLARFIWTKLIRTQRARSLATVYWKFASARACKR